MQQKADVFHSLVNSLLGILRCIREKAIAQVSCRNVPIALVWVFVSVSSSCTADRTDLQLLDSSFCAAASENTQTSPLLSCSLQGG